MVYSVCAFKVAFARPRSWFMVFSAGLLCFKLAIHGSDSRSTEDCNGYLTQNKLPITQQQSCGKEKDPGADEVRPSTAIRG